MGNIKKRSVVLMGLLLLFATSAVVLIARTGHNPLRFFARKRTAPAAEQGRTENPAKTNTRPMRNLSLQPQAFQMGRRLGHRFDPEGRDKSVSAGTLTMASDSRPIQIIRSQTDDGEQVEIHIAGQGSLTWDAASGALSSKARARGSEHELIERIAFDSPDQFVLAQLRGAAYYTVARNLRPANADDNYNGPVWDVVRITDPEQDESKQTLSRWRLYYLNTRTGLIDKIESEINGQRIIAEVEAWTDVNGEKIPSEMRWTSNGQVLMHYSLTNFARATN